jgi:hypothetical protein
MRARHGVQLLAAATLCLAAACTATQPKFPALAFGETIPGFWRGVWHGFIAPAMFFVSLVSSEVRIYAFPNAGRWYDLGFLLGIGGFTGGLFARPRPRRIRQ